MKTHAHFSVRSNGFHFFWSALALALGLGLTVGVLSAFAKNNDRISMDNQPVKPSALADFLVNYPIDTHDEVPGDGLCADFDGYCSLRAAIEESNAQAGADITHLPANTYNLVKGQLEITDALEIIGSGATTTIINAQGNSRVLLVDKAGAIVSSPWCSLG